MSVLTLQAVRDIGNVTSDAYDAQITRKLTTVQAKCERYCQREFDYGTYTEYHDADAGQGIIYVRRPPIIAISALTHNEPLSPLTIDHTNDVRTGSEWTILGRVELYNSESCYYQGSGSVKVVYTGGYTTTTVPDVLAEAIALQILFELNHAERIGLRGIKSDGASADYDERYGLARHVCEQLDPYVLHHRSILP